MADYPLFTEHWVKYALPQDPPAVSGRGDSAKLLDIVPDLPGILRFLIHIKPPQDRLEIAACSLESIGSQTLALVESLAIKRHQAVKEKAMVWGSSSSNPRWFISI